MESAKGFPYSTVILYSGIGLFILFGVAALLTISPTDENAPDWQFFLLIGISQLFFGLIGSRTFPNARTIKLFEDHIDIMKGSEVIKLPITDIKRIAKYSSFANQTFSSHEFYKIQLKEGHPLGKMVCFRIKSKERAKFIQALEMAWYRSHKK